MNISILGWYGQGNIGDESFRTAFNRIFAGHELEFVTPPNKPNNPDIVVLGGGAVASPFYLECLPTNCPLYALGIDLAYESEADLLGAVPFKEMFIRTQTDVAALKQKLDIPVHYTPDLSFMLRPKSRNILKKYHRYNPRAKKMAVFATDYVNPAIDRPASKFSYRSFSFAENLGKELSDFVKQGWEVYILCCSTGGYYGDDRRMALQLGAFMPRHPIIILDTLKPQEMIDFIAQMDVTVCMRFHAHLFSIIAGTPFVSLGQTRKVKMLMKEGNMGQTAAYFDGDVFNTCQFKETVHEALNQDCHKQLRRHASANYNKLQEIMQKVRRGWLR